MMAPGCGRVSTTIIMGFTKNINFTVVIKLGEKVGDTTVMLPCRGRVSTTTVKSVGQQ